MNALLVAINAKYIHTNIAVRYLQKFAAPHLSEPPRILEMTINNRTDQILDEIFRHDPQVLLFSTYIWNVRMVQDLAREYRKICPDVLIAAGGPEVSYESAAFLRENPAFDLVLYGEGEKTFSQLMQALEQGEDWTGLSGITWRSGQSIFQNPPQLPLDLSQLPFPYEAQLIAQKDQIKYYESSRGCPYQCQYCLSSIEKGVRMAPLDKVFSELRLFIDAKVRQVKFVDRTFNCDRKRALSIWKFLSENDNGVTNFHFEITAELLDEEALAFLSTVRPELFQFEIGVQSTNPETLLAIRRQNDWEKLCKTVNTVKSFRNIHQHLDLIAGLPFEDYDSFHKSFNDVYSLQPEQFQLGFLKLLKGAGLFRDREKYGLTARDYPPFEILSTPALPYEDVLRLKAVEEMVEQYYNSGRFVHTLRWLFTRMDDPFLFYQQLGDRYVENRLHLSSQSLESAYSFFYEFAASLPYVNGETLAQYLKLDYCLHQRPKRFPAWYPGPDAVRLRRDCIAFLTEEENRQRYLPQQKEPDPQKLYKLCWFEPFSFDILSREDSPCVLLFDYSRRDLLGNAHAEKVTLPKLAD